MRKATLDEYAEPTLSSPAVRAVAAKVVAEVRPDFDARFPALWPAEVEIETVDGRTLRMQTDFPKGDPQNRLSDGGDVRQVPLARRRGARATASSTRSRAPSPPSRATASAR